MGYPLDLAFRYMASKKGAFVSIGTAFAIVGVTLGVAALAIVMSVTGGFQEQFREKVLGVNAHVLVLKYSIDFREYRDIMRKVDGLEIDVPRFALCPWSFCPSRRTKVIGTAPFVINPMMVTHGERTATGVLLKGVDPDLLPKVLDLPKHVVEGKLEGLRKSGSKPPERKMETFRWDVRDVTPAEDAGALSPTRALREGATDAGASSPRNGSSGGGDARDDGDDLEPDTDTPATGDAGRGPHVDARPLSRPGDARSSDAGAWDAAGAGGSAVGGSGPSAAGLVGSVTPAGGFASQLPDVDVLPDFVDPDPCKSPEQVAKLPGVVVGRTLMKTLGIGIGDCVQITSPTIGLSLGAAGGRPPVAKQFRVIAAFEAGFDQYDSKLVYTDLYEAQAFYEYGDSVTGVEMKITDIDDGRDFARYIDKLLANSVYHTMDWKELNHGLFTALLIQQIGMSVVLALIIVVAAFTVIATLIMVVLDKKKEIALLKALGAKDVEILWVFLYQGAIIGVVGTVLGLALGYVGCKALLAWGFPLDPKVYFISKLPVNLRPTEFCITGVFAILICLAATIFPALYAAKLRPSEGLRAE